MTVVLGLVMSMLDTTSVNVALHDLARDFGVSVRQPDRVSHPPGLGGGMVLPVGMAMLIRLLHSPTLQLREAAAQGDAVG